MSDPKRSPLRLAIGCDLELRCDQLTPVLALVHPHDSLQADLQQPETLTLHPDRPVEVLRDRGGNRWCRFVAPPGTTSLRYGAVIVRPAQLDATAPRAALCPVQFLPIEAYPFLNASTYCDTPALMDLAWHTFGAGDRGWSLVQRVCDWVHAQVRFDYAASRPHQTASQTAAAGAGVCRDFAHLAITLCRCLNIPARYCTGYLGYTGVVPGEAPVDFSAWFEVFLDDRWYVFDARHNVPRCGRVLIARGRDAGDVPFLRSFGDHQLAAFRVVTEEVHASQLQRPGLERAA